MIAKIIKGKDFYGVLAYNDKKVEEGRGHVIDTNIADASTVEKTRMFNMVRVLRPNLRKAVLHVSLNLPYQDQLSDKKFAQLGNDYLKGMGFDDNQFIIYRHSDQDHQHIHIIANRVQYSGKVVDDSRDLFRSKKLVRKLEEKYGLVQLEETTKQKKSQITQKELEKAIRTGEAPIRFILQEEVKRAVGQSKGIKDFIQNLHAVNIHPKFNISKSTGRISGISFKYEGIIYKGSTLGRGYSWNTISKTIDYEQDRDRSIVLQANSAEQGNWGKALRATGRPQEVAQQSAAFDKKPAHLIEKSNNHLGYHQAYYRNIEAFNGFKLELEDQSRKKKRKGLKRKI